MASEFDDLIGGELKPTEIQKMAVEDYIKTGRLCPTDLPFSGCNSPVRGENAQGLLRSRQEEVAAACGVTAERVISEYARIAFFDPRQLFDVDGNPVPLHLLPEGIAAAISGVDVSSSDLGGNIKTKVLKYKLSDKRAALDALAKNLNLIPDRVEVTGKGGGAIEMTDNDAARRVAFLLNKALREKVVN